MNKHTPGPWEIIAGFNIYTPLGAESGDGVKADETDGWCIASIGDTPTFVDGESVHLGRDIQRANAHLIAAAPDLLAVLQAFERIVDIWLPAEVEEQHGEELYALHQARNDMLAAIVRARGEA